MQNIALIIDTVACCCGWFLCSSFRMNCFSIFSVANCSLTFRLDYLHLDTFSGSKMCVHQQIYEVLRFMPEDIYRELFSLCMPCWCLMHEEKRSPDQISGLIKFQFLFQQMLLLFGFHRATLCCLLMCDERETAVCNEKWKFHVLIRYFSHSRSLLLVHIFFCFLFPVLSATSFVVEYELLMNL